MASFLEIIAEGKIAQHFKKRVMAGGISNIFEVVMLASGADTFLGRHRTNIFAFLVAGEDILELHHARIGEQQGRVVLRHQ